METLPPEARCRNCRWWRDDWLPPNGGRIEIAGSPTDKRRCASLLVAGSVMNGNPFDEIELYTAPDFGCVHFEERLRGEDLTDDPELKRKFLEAKAREAKRKGL